MTTPEVPATEGPIAVDVPPPNHMIDYDPMVVVLENVEEQGNTALLNLQAAIETAERAMAQMQVRVDLGQMGAESIPQLETAIAEAKQVQSEMKTQVEDVQAQQAQIIEAAQEAAASGTVDQ